MRRYEILVAIVALSAALGGCEEQQQTTLKSPVQAVTTLVERSNGRVDAELVLITTAVTPNEFVDTADMVRIRVPGGAEVGLARTSSGHYTSNSTLNAELVYAETQTYQFKFELDDDDAQQVAGGNFTAVMMAPAGPVSFNIDKAPAFDGDTGVVSWLPAQRYGLIRVTDAVGAVVYENFDFSQPQFNGSKWARLKVGSDVLGVDVFDTPGDYSIEVCAVEKTSGFDPSLSAELGVLSGFLIGRCAAAQTITVPD